ncbi:CU044_5270 family protein [Streptomyces sp. MNU76]|uniref:CU044_5270 family protein n=1 Tax=Streptomyces sp. MNU76 TaxID=2560026 RepID=UPI001E29CB0B|nr:CU044_5270 family protein [Streptomyces sp. MNU76]MCC9706688.1 CU044_5270 family protein [Streptomyces sp. MNU76]
MTKLHELRADAPTPERARLVPGRRQLLSAAQQGSARRTRWDWRVTAAGVAATVVTIAVLVTMLVGGDEPERGVQPAGPDLTSATALLEQAAEVVSQQPDLRPRDGQWVYLKTARCQYGASDAAPDAEPEVSEEWVQYDSPVREDDTDGDDEPSQRRLYRLLASLPDDPAEIRERAADMFPMGEDTGLTDEQIETFALLATLDEAYPVPPQGMAKLFRALAADPGIKVVPHLVKDPMGQDAIAIYPDLGSKVVQRREYLLDPDTFQYQGTQSVAVRDYDEKYEDGSSVGGSYKKGDVTFCEMKMTQSLVDRDGEKP